MDLPSDNMNGISEEDSIRPDYHLKVSIRYTVFKLLYTLKVYFFMGNFFQGWNFQILTWVAFIALSEKYENTRYE